MTADLFPEQLMSSSVMLAQGAYWLKGHALPEATNLCNMLNHHLKKHAPQQMTTPMGYKMSVRTTSFGQIGWVSTERGYGYAKYDAVTKQPWPAIPDLLLRLASQAAEQAGYQQFVPDTCLINVYDIGSKMGLHQDNDEQDFSQPIVSVSLGIPATFLFGGTSRADKPRKIPLTHGDVVVWGGESRLNYHGILPLKAAQHHLLGQTRINLTFRKAGKM
jgi:DNA oxidative demethylase